MLRQRWVRVTLVLIALLAAFSWLRGAVGLAFGPESIRETVGRLGPWGPIAYMAIVAFRVPLGMPSSVVLVAGGLLFGSLLGTLYGAAGIVASACALFVGARWGGREAVQARLPERVLPMLAVAGSRLGAAFVALGTAYPMSPVSIYHLLAGITAMSPVLFGLAVVIGSLTRAAIYTYFGSSLVEADVGRILLASVLLLGATLAPLAFPTPRRWLLQTIAQRDSR